MSEKVNETVETKEEVKAEVKEEVKAEPKAEKAKKATTTSVKKAKNVLQKLRSIQTTIKAPKNLRNTFGGYNYRNAEGILESVKPYLEKEDCVVLLEDEITLIGDRFYVKAIAKFIDCESGDQIEVSALARESLDKKGMDSSQVTGATSSYARKYALNGLFLLDDTKDADKDEYQKTTGNTNSNTNNNYGKSNFQSGNKENHTAGGEKW